MQGKVNGLYFNASVAHMFIFYWVWRHYIRQIPWCSPPPPRPQIDGLTTAPYKGKIVFMNGSTIVTKVCVSRLTFFKLYTEPDCFTSLFLHRILARKLLPSITISLNSIPQFLMPHGQNVFLECLVYAHVFCFQSGIYEVQCKVS